VFGAAGVESVFRSSVATISLLFGGPPSVGLLHRPSVAIASCDALVAWRLGQERIHRLHFETIAVKQGAIQGSVEPLRQLQARWTNRAVSSESAPTVRQVPELWFLPFRIPDFRVPGFRHKQAMFPPFALSFARAMPLELLLP
jgi:hypothetical protein